MIKVNLPVDDDDSVVGIIVIGDGYYWWWACFLNINNVGLDCLLFVVVDV